MSRGESTNNGSGNSHVNGKNVFAMTWEQRELAAAQYDIYKILEPGPQ
jgi:hypothetical protein